MQPTEESFRLSNSKLWKFSTGIVLLFVVLLLVHALPFHPAVTYAIVFVAASLIYLWIAWTLRSTELSGRMITLVLAAALLVQLSFLTLAPIGSDDVYRYMWEGKVQASGINPYRYAPNDTALAALHSPLLPNLVNHPDMKSVYFPVGHWVFDACYRLSGESIWGYKLALLLAQIATLVGLFSLLKKLAIPLKYILLYGLCPLPIIQFGLDAHIDAIGLPLLILGLILYLDGRKLLAYAYVALSISIKPVAVLLLPILFLREKGWREKATVVVVPSGILAAQFLPYVFGANPLEALFTFASHWTFNGAVFETVNLYFADNQTSRLICAALLAVSLLLVYWRRKDVLDAFSISVLLLLLFSPVVHPWYVSWLTVLLPFARRWSGIVYSAAASLTVYTVLLYKLYGSWEQSALVLAIEYVPVVVLLFLELRKKSPSGWIHMGLRI